MPWVLNQLAGPRTGTAAAFTFCVVGVLPSPSNDGVGRVASKFGNGAQ